MNRLRSRSRLPYCLLTLLFLFAPFVARAADPVPPEEAFVPHAWRGAENSIVVDFTIREGYYLYRDKLKFTATAPAGAQLHAPRLPPGEAKQDEFLGDVYVYRDRVAIPLPYEGEIPQRLRLTYQGCWDGGICFPPVVTDLEVAAAPPAASLLQRLRGAVETSPAATSEAAPPASALPADESGRLAQALAGRHWAPMLATFFGLGLLLAFTPCTFPMIPIVSGIIVGGKEHVSRGRAFGLSLAYVLAMAAVYALAGALAGLSGTMLSAALQTPWVLGGFALVFVLLSLSMFGLYELQLPSSWQTRLDAAAGRLPGGRYLGVAFMGAISALVVGPCVAAPLAGAMLYIARTGDAWLGGWALFALGLGMGAPLVAVGMGARELLPRSGPWLTGVKRTFGVLMLALAWWIVRPVAPDWLWLLGWALLALGTGVFLHAIDPLPPQAPAMRRLGKAVGLALATYGIVALIGLLSGGRDPLQPLALRLSAASAAAAPAQQVPTVRSLAELEAAVRASDRPVLVDVRADWCVSCLELERVTLDDPRVRERLAGVVRVGADVTAADESARALLRRFELFGPPALLFFSPGGAERSELRVAGYLGPDELLPRLERWLGR